MTDPEVRQYLSTVDLLKQLAVDDPLIEMPGEVACFFCEAMVEVESVPFIHDEACGWYAAREALGESVTGHVLADA